MRAASAGLIAILENAEKSFRMADLFTFTLYDGTVLRYTSADLPLTLDGNTYSPLVVSGARFRIRVGLEVDEMDLEISPLATDLVNGVPMIIAARVGVFDGAYVQRERVFMTTWGDTSAGSLILFFGKVADLGINSMTVSIKVKSLMELLNVEIPKHITQPGCVWALFDAGCGLTPVTFAITGVVGVGSTVSRIVSGLAQPDEYFTRGKIVFTSGVNNGVQRSVSKYNSGNIDMLIPLSAVPTAGDTYTAYPGCNKTMAVCNYVFNNISNFRGFPFIPNPETSAGLSNG